MITTGVSSKRGYTVTVGSRRYSGISRYSWLRLLRHIADNDLASLADRPEGVTAFRGYARREVVVKR